MPRGDLILGIDLGTTALKGAVYDLAGTMLFSGSAGYQTQHSQPGWAEQRPADWMHAFQSVINAAASQIDLAEVQAVGICSQVNTHVFVDANRNVLMPAVVWQDQRCAGIAGELEVPARQAGLQIALDSSSLACRAEWLRQEHPALWDATRFILSPKDYCIAILTGEVATDALSSIGLVTAEQTYEPQLDRLVPGLVDRLPPIRPITEQVGAIRHPDVPLRCPVVIGTMDAWASLYGSGVSDAGAGFEISGTSEIIGALSHEATSGTGVVTFPKVDGAYLHAGPTQCGGDALVWFAQSIGKSVEQALEMAQRLPAGRAPLLFLPHLMGERAPLWDPLARGAFVGLTKTHSAADLVYAVLEGVGFSARQLLGAVEAASGVSLERLRLSGGGSRSDLWCQIKADIHGKTLERVKNIDTGSFGAALLAAVGVDRFPNIRTAAQLAVDVDREFVPNTALADRYDELYDLYGDAYAGLRETFAALAGMHAM